MKIKDNNIDIYENEHILHDTSNKNFIIDLSGVQNLKGRHNYQNIAFTYAVCSRIGIWYKSIIHSIENFVPLPHRLNVVRKIRNITFVNDSKATNPNSASKALESFSGYKIYWLVGGRSKKIDPIPYVKYYLVWIQMIYLFGESMDEFEAIFKSVNKKTIRCNAMDIALKIAYKHATGDDLGPSVILLSPMCSSFDQFKNFEQRGNEFVKLVMDLNDI